MTKMSVTKYSYQEKQISRDAAAFHALSRFVF